jgi:signal-transduction protein with cAMP-binding, CBS, and nucleotidyltransferase domain
MENLKLYFESVGFKENSLSAIIDAFEISKFKKNDFIVAEGKVSKHIGIVKSGMLHYYTLRDGEEKTHYISIANTWFASLLSFISESPSLENITALTDSSLYTVSKVNLKKLVHEVPGFKDFYVGLLEVSICGIDEDRHDLIVLTAEQRYEKMLKKEPHLLQQIPLQYLASMLGVTQGT